MKTSFYLLAQFEKPIIPLEDISEEYFGCSRSTAIQKAKSGTLPVPAFQCGQSQKSTWMVHINDLATMIDQQREAAKEDWVGG
ncbi:MAG: pyocin activator PrtN family protein [Halopseudomonas aestusnigri]